MNSKDKIRLVIGLGASGLATANWLKQKNINFLCWDDSEIARLAAITSGFSVAESIDSIDFSTVAQVITSPGIPLEFPAPNPIIAAAKANAIPIIGDIGLFINSIHGGNKNHKTIGITGTNGKSTTTALLHHILTKSGKSAFIGGNFGVPVLNLPIDIETSYFVLELSSFQLDLNIPYPLDIAILLNITPDHLDRHGSLAGYCAVKKRIFNHQTTENLAIISIDDRNCLEIAAQINSKNQVRFSVFNNSAAQYFIKDKKLTIHSDGQEKPIYDLSRLEYLSGNHNYQNLIAAFIAAEYLGLSHSQIFDAIESFRGLAHRQEFVAQFQNIKFINDSKATNADATLPALQRFENILWLLGGKPKEGGISSLQSALESVAFAYCYGEAAIEFAQDLAKFGIDYAIAQDKSLENALAAAIAFALENPAKNYTVLLSPAAASYDQFVNFEDRGNKFKMMVSKKIESITGK